MHTEAFRVERDPAPDLLSAVARSEPTNPFFTAPYVEARRCLGDEAVVLGLWSSADALITACPAYIRRARLRGGLHIPSLPAIPERGEFWNGVLRFCRGQRLRLLTVDTFGSGIPVSIPRLSGELTRRRRCEFVLAVHEVSPARFSSNHRRNIARARGQGISIRRTHTADACTAHDRLVQMSLNRRAARGETISAGNELNRYEAMTRTRAGELFQAVRNDEVISSLLVLRAEAGAYYQSAGTSPEGMVAGASHFLVSEIASCLHDEGLQVFNLGGVGEEASGLRRFKEGFGAIAVPLEAAQFSMEPFIMRKARGVLRALRTRSRELRSISDVD